MEKSTHKKHHCKPKEWVQNYSDEFYRFSLLRVSDSIEAEDLVQETFYSALKNVDKFRGDSTEKTWLYNILKNKIIDFYRKNKNKTFSSSELLREDDTDDDSFYSRYFKQDGLFGGHWVEEQMPGKWGENLNDNLEREEFMEILRNCISYLPKLWASVFRMKHFMENESKEICKELEITSSNLWVIVHRTKLQLRGCLEKNWINQ